MIYEELDYLPYKTLLKVLETGNYKLLTTDPDTPEEILAGAWEKLYKEYLAANHSPEEDRVFKIRKEVYHLEARYELILIYCKILAFDWHEETAESLKKYGYIITPGSCLQKIPIIKREAEGLLVKAKQLRSQLPVVEENVKVSVDDMLACYTTILGIDIGDYNTVSSTKVFALGKQVDLKVKQIQKTNQDAK